MSHRLRVAASLVEKAGFGAAALAFLAPFFVADPNDVHSVRGVLAFSAGFYLVLVPRSDALTYFVAYSVPGIAAIAGLLLLPRRLTWPASVARLACALTGLAGLTSIVFANPRPYLLIGYYAAEAAFLVAAVASAYRLIATLRLRGLGDEARDADMQPAWSASQELLRRHRDSW